MDADATQPFCPPDATCDVVPRTLFRSLRFWIPVVICAFALLAVPIAFVIGAMIGNTQIYSNFSSQQQTRIEVFLAQHPESFGDLTVEHASNGWAYPSGTVRHQVDFDLLADALHEMFGDELGNRMLGPVQILAEP